MFQGDVYQGNDDYSLGSVTSFGSPDANEEMIGMRGLWCAVLLQAIHDFFGKTNSKGNLSQADMEKAKHWLLSKNRDFDDVCIMAGMSPAMVRKEVRKLLEKGGYTFRAAAGTGKRYEERKKYREQQKLRMKSKPRLRLVYYRIPSKTTGASM